MDKVNAVNEEMAKERFNTLNSSDVNLDQEFNKCLDWKYLDLIPLRRVFRYAGMSFMLN